MLKFKKIVVEDKSNNHELYHKSVEKVKTTLKEGLYEPTNFTFTERDVKNILERDKASHDISYGPSLLLRDGSMYNVSNYGGYHETFAGSIPAALGQEVSVEDDDNTYDEEALEYLEWELGIITLNAGMHEYEDRTKIVIDVKPSEAQYKSLLEFIDLMQVVAGPNALLYVYARGQQQTYSLATYTSDEIVKKIRKAYAFGRLEEDRLEEKDYKLPTKTYDFNDENKSLTWDKDAEDYIYWGSEADKWAEDYAKSYKVQMSPKDFLDLTTQNGASSLKKGDNLGLGALRDLDKDELNQWTHQPIYLNIAFRDDKHPEQAQVVGHEGRHRMFALMQAGYNKVDVELHCEVWDTNFNKYKPFVLDKIILQGQFNKSVFVTVYNPFPLSWKNHKSIRPELKDESLLEELSDNEYLDELDKMFGQEETYMWSTYVLPNGHFLNPDNAQEYFDKQEYSSPGYEHYDFEDYLTNKYGNKAFRVFEKYCMKMNVTYPYISIPANRMTNEQYNALRKIIDNADMFEPALNDCIDRLQSFTGKEYKGKYDIHSPLLITSDSDAKLYDLNVNDANTIIKDIQDYYRSGSFLSEALEQKDIIDFAMRNIGTSDKPIDGPSYILPNGKYLTIWRSKIPVSKYSSSGSATHRDVQQFLFDNGLVKDDFWNVEDPDLERLGCIRVNSGFEEYIWLPDKRPNETQWQSLLVWLDWYFAFHKKLTVGYYHYAPKTYFASEYTTDEILKKCKEAYARGYLTEKIVKVGNKWQVQSEKGRNLGTYDTKKEAEKRLKQVEYFKHMKEDYVPSEDDFPYDLEDICNQYSNLISDTYQSCGPAFIMPDGRFILSGKKFEAHADFAFDSLLELGNYEDEEEIEDTWDIDEILPMFTKYFNLVRVNDGTGLDNRAYFVIVNNTITNGQQNSLLQYLDTIIKKHSIRGISCYVGKNDAYKYWQMSYQLTSDEIMDDVRFAMTRGFFAESLDEDYKDDFINRTTQHIARVNKYANKINKSYPNHDSDKFNELFDGYSLMNKKDVSEEEQKMIDDATYKHVINNEHHCEHWCNPKDVEGFSRSNPTPHGCLDCTKMPEDALEEMCCDWCAMSEEFNNTPFEWFDKVKDTRWHFNEKQEKFILDTLHKLWDEKDLKESKQDKQNFIDKFGQDRYNKFDALKDRLSNKDIYYWLKKDEKELDQELERAQKEKDQKSKSKEDAKKVFEDDNWIVLDILSTNSAKKYGKSTKWCISAENVAQDGKTAETHWKEYIDRGATKFYFVINKKDDREKYCVVHYNNKPKEFWASNDTNVLSIPNGPDFEPVKQDDDVPSIIKESAKIIAEMIASKHPSKKDKFRTASGLKLWLTLNYKNKDNIVKLFANYAGTFGQFGNAKELYDIYTSKEEYKNILINEVINQVKTLDDRYWK